MNSLASFNLSAVELGSYTIGLSAVSISAGSVNDVDIILIEERTDMFFRSKTTEVLRSKGRTFDLVILLWKIKNIYLTFGLKSANT